MTVTTGYSMDQLKGSLFELSTFMSENLHPDRLRGYNLNAIKNITPYDQIPANVGLDLNNYK